MMTASLVERSLGFGVEEFEAFGSGLGDLRACGFQRSGGCGSGDPLAHFGPVQEGGRLHVLYGAAEAT